MNADPRFISENPRSQFEVEIDVASEANWLVVNHRRRERPAAGGVLSGFAEQRRTFRVSYPNLSVFIDDRKHPDGSGHVMSLRLRRVKRRNALRFAATERARADQLWFRSGRGGCGYRRSVNWRRVRIRGRCGGFRSEWIRNAVSNGVKRGRATERCDLNLRRRHFLARHQVLRLPLRVIFVVSRE